MSLGLGEVGFRNQVSFRSYRARVKIYSYWCEPGTFYINEVWIKVIILFYRMIRISQS